MQKLLSEKQMKFPSKGKKAGASLALRRQLVPWDVRTWVLSPGPSCGLFLVWQGRVCGVAKLCCGSRAPGASQAGAVSVTSHRRSQLPLRFALTLQINILCTFGLEKRTEAELCWVGSCCV